MKRSRRLTIPEKSPGFHEIRLSLQTPAPPSTVPAPRANSNSDDAEAAKLLPAPFGQWHGVRGEVPASGRFGPSERRKCTESGSGGIPAPGLVADACGSFPESRQLVTNQGMNAPFQ